MSDSAHQAPPATEQRQHDANILSNLALRMFKFASPAQGFDQGDVDQLYRIARDLAAPPATEPTAAVRKMKLWHGGVGAPADWDEHGPVMRRDGVVLSEALRDSDFWDFERSDRNLLNDFIAYTPLATLHTRPPVATATVVDAVAAAMVAQEGVGPWDKMPDKAPRGWGATAGRDYWRKIAAVALAATPTPTAGDK